MGTGCRKIRFISAGYGIRQLGYLSQGVDMRDPRALVAIKLPRIVVYDLLDKLDRRQKAMDQHQIGLSDPDIEHLIKSLTKFIKEDK
jgi:hypothetical protein